MTDISAKSPTITIVPTADLGGPGKAVFARCSEVAIAALTAVAGEGFRMTSLSLDVASHALGEDAVEVTARADKRTWTIVFASVEARSGGRMVFSAQGLFGKG
jgi:hypothetical protein